MVYFVKDTQLGFFEFEKFANISLTDEQVSTLVSISLVVFVSESFQKHVTDKLNENQSIDIRSTMIDIDNRIIMIHDDDMIVTLNDNNEWTIYYKDHIRLPTMRMIDKNAGEVYEIYPFGATCLYYSNQYRNH